MGHARAFFVGIYSGALFVVAILLIAIGIAIDRTGLAIQVVVSVIGSAVGVLMAFQVDEAVRSREKKEAAEERAGVFARIRGEVLTSITRNTQEARNLFQTLRSFSNNLGFGTSPKPSWTPLESAVWETLRGQYAALYTNPQEASRVALFFADLERLQRMLDFIRVTDTAGALGPVPLQATDLCEKLTKDGAALAKELGEL